MQDVKLRSLLHRSGVAFSLTVTVQDACNVVTGYTGTIHFTSTDSRASLPANYTFRAADKGVHTFTGLVLRKRGRAKDHPYRHAEQFAHRRRERERAVDSAKNGKQRRQNPRAARHRHPGSFSWHALSRCEGCVTACGGFGR
jgi:hypothetical protein